MPVIPGEAERARCMAAIPARGFFERQIDAGRLGAISLSQLILRYGLDHEIHHRGSLQLALRLRYP